MDIIKLTFSGTNHDIMARIVRVLAVGGVIVYPIDTVYGLGALISCQSAVEKIKHIKGRYQNKPLSILVRDLPMAKQCSQLPAMANKYLPGPYTVLVKKKSLVPEWISSSNLVGIRCPKYWFTSQLMQYIQEPIVTTSANLSGHPPVYSVEELLKQLGQVGCLQRL